MSGRTVHERISAAALHAGLKGHYGSRSPRIGMIQELHMANMNPEKLMHAEHWRFPPPPHLFIRNLSAGRNAVATWYTQKPGSAPIK